MLGWRFVLGLCCALTWSTLTCATLVRADDTHQSYEEDRLQVALQEAGLEIDDAPVGKQIAFIRLVRHDVFIEEELWPVWPNMFHTLSEEALIEREYLFAVGQPYTQALIDETERNLRGMTLFAILRIVAVKTAEPGKVGILVHTRDLWSLRTEWDLQATGLSIPQLLFTEVPMFAVHNTTLPWAPSGIDFGDTVVDRALFQITERNLAGYGKTIIARLQANPITFSVGEVFQDRRLALGEHRLDQIFDVFLNRSSGDVEGSQGQLILSKPFYNLAQTLSYRVDASYITKISRVLQTGRVATYDVPETEEVERISRLWDDDTGAVTASATHRFGERFKHAFTVGAGYRDRSVRPNGQTGVDAEDVSAFRRDVLPRVRREVYPSVGIEIFEARYEVFRELATFGQSENVRVGPSMSISTALPLSAWGSSTDSMTLSINAGYVLPFSGGIVESAIGAYGRYENGELINQFMNLHLRGATPPMLAGRIAFRMLWEGRRRDTDNTAVWLGGDNGLRGYPSQALIGFGASRVLTSLEYRTQPINWRSTHIGFVLFYDAGAVYEALHQARMRYAVGTGFRVLFPQFDRFVFRVDLGVPLNEPGFQLLAGFGGGQALPLTATEDERLAATY